MDRSQAYRSFLLTAWQERSQQSEHESIWRFGLEDVRGKSQKRVFVTLEEVMEHVKEKLETMVE